MARACLALIVLMVLTSGAQAKSLRDAPGADAPRSFRDCPACPEMMVAPAGEFLMGAPDSELGRGKDEGPQRRVTIAQPFAVGKFEVTFAEWDACAAQGGCTQKPGDEGWGHGKRPVINVSWRDAVQYTEWLTAKTGKPYRLLSEAEWEYAARGVTKASAPHTPFATGATINYKQANFDANFTYGSGKMGVYRQKTLDVGSLPRNAFGLHDMHGNVWEWVQDCYKPTYEGAPADGSAVVVFGDCRLHIMRGGSWNYHPKLLRSAYRYVTPPDVRLNNAGFRVARSM
jgi:formylglycine-generating enzyme required for sulfatase activity